MAASLVAVAAVAALAAIWLNANPPTSSDPSSVLALASSQPSQPFASNIAPKRDEAEVRQIATTHLGRLAEAAESRGLSPEAISIQSVASTPWAEIAKLEPRLLGPEAGSIDASRIVWVVRGDGTFLVLRTPPGKDPFVGKTGYLLIDDETGTILGLGTP